MYVILTEFPMQKKYQPTFLARLRGPSRTLSPKVSSSSSESSPLSSLKPLSALNSKNSRKYRRYEFADEKVSFSFYNFALAINYLLLNESWATRDFLAANSRLRLLHSISVLVFFCLADSHFSRQYSSSCFNSCNIFRFCCNSYRNIFSWVCNCWCWACIRPTMFQVLFSSDETVDNLFSCEGQWRNVAIGKSSTKKNNAEYPLKCRMCRKISPARRVCSPNVCSASSFDSSLSLNVFFPRLIP